MRQQLLDLTRALGWQPHRPSAEPTFLMLTFRAMESIY